MVPFRKIDMKKILLVAITLLAIGCTDNKKARSFGGTETISLEPNEKFINVTWKESNLWIIVQDTVTGDYIAREKSSFGVWEGKIIIKKHR